MGKSGGAARRAVQTTVAERSASVVGAGDQHLAKAMREATEAESALVGLPYERARVYPVDENTLRFFTDGTPEGVSFNATELQHMRGALLTHNHPIPRGLSRHDVELFYASGLRQLRAVTPKFTYVLERPRERRLSQNLWSSGAGVYHGIDSRGHGDTYNAIWRGVAKALARQVTRGRISPAQADDLLPYEIMRRFAHATGLTYYRVRRG